jgi:hypothetical protein
MFTKSRLLEVLFVCRQHLKMVERRGVLRRHQHQRQQHAHGTAHRQPNRPSRELHQRLQLLPQPCHTHTQESRSVDLVSDGRSTNVGIPTGWEQSDSLQPI